MQYFALKRYSDHATFQIKYKDNVSRSFRCMSTWHMWHLHYLLSPGRVIAKHRATDGTLLLKTFVPELVSNYS